ncbi:Coiled-coil domain-containing protein 47 [Trametes pubescens]|uniref:Coiled-coil domain-containing protein 47 n=1 Tax=Trametes pubescens TaxID=154538 RepID=A0A1M2V822_TRAPU|nr:Coiled-coil domain-containing protein 47 [Trametes pubescens]
MAALNNIAKFLTPPMPNVSVDYDGFELRYKFLVFRPAYFKNEVYFLGAALLYVIFYFVGKKANERKAHKWFEAHEALYKLQFSKPTHTEGLSQDGNSDFFAFSTGRRALTSLHTTFTLRPRHDLFQTIFHFVRGLVELDYKVYDEVELEFTFREGAAPETVWAVVAKDELKKIRDERWDLTFTKTTDTTALPASLAVMSEFADVTTNLLKPYGAFSLPAVLSLPAIQPYFRSLSLTDQPRTRPSHALSPSERTRRLILTLALPPTSDSAATLPLVTAAFQLVDVIAGAGRLPGLAAALRPETKTKLRKMREEVERQIRDEGAREKREEAEEQKAAARKKAQDERLSKLSAAEQKKALDREKKRAMRKTQGKTKMR